MNGTGIVQFSKYYTTVYYTDAQSGVNGYISPYCAADAIYLGELKGKIKFKIAGVTGLIEKKYVNLVTYQKSHNVSYYYVWRQFISCN